MADFAIVTDSFCELSKEIRDRFEIDFTPGHIALPDGTEAKLNLDWDLMSSDDFYKSIKKDPDMYKTSPANVAELTEKFESYVKEGKGILVVTISTGISGTYNFSLQAKKQILEKYPEAKIEVIDSLRYGHGHGLMCIHASEMRAAGKSLEEVYNYLETNKNTYRQGGWLDDLTFVAKKGRISNAKAFFGTLVGIKPIGEFDGVGLTTILGNVKGEKNGYKVALDYIENTSTDLKNQTIIIGYTQRKKQAEAFKAMVQERFQPKEILMCEVYYGCGINVGPGLMSAYYSGTPISKGLEEEKKLLSELVLKNK